MTKKNRIKPVQFLRSRAWKELRERVLERDEHRCVLCGSDKNLQVHHIFPRKFHKELQCDIDNLITLCTRHHWAQHEDAGCFQLAVFLMQSRQEQWKWILEHLKFT